MAGLGSRKVAGIGRSGWALLEYLVVAGFLVVTFVLMRSEVEKTADKAVQEIEARLTYSEGTVDSILNY